MLRLFAATLAVVLALSQDARAQNEFVVTGSGDTTIENGETILRGARATDGELLLTADEFRVSPDRRRIVASGRVVLTQRGVRLLADRLTYHRADGAFEAERVRLGAHPYFAEAESARGTLKEITLVRATATYGEPSAWHPTLVADKIIYAPGQRLRTENSRLGIGHAQPVPLPQLTQNLKQQLFSYASLTGGVRRSLGAFVEAGLHLPAPDLAGLRLGGDVGLYTSRGLMFGPSGGYDRTGDGGEMHGGFRSGYINDHGDKKTDLLGRAVPENRAYAEWQHRQTVGDNLTLTAQLNWWKDSEILRDFRPRAFFPVQQPDSFVEAVHAGRNYFVSLFTRVQPNNFGLVQERLPELRFDLLPLAIGGGLIERFSASVVRLRDDPATGRTVAFALGGRRSDRVDAYYSISRPITIEDWLAFTPVAGGRATHYTYTRGTPQGGNFTRVLGEAGFDAALRTSGTFDYKNAHWKIDGLRHLVTPRVSYRYIPEAAKGRARIPPIDRESFATYLPPLGLGDHRNLDDLRATNTLRVGLDQTLQTRDPAYGSRDLLVFNLANDFRFKRTAGERVSSEVHAEIGITPARWLEAGIYQSFSPRDRTMREFNTAITLRDGDRATVRFANNFLRRELHDYTIDGRWRLHERFDALLRLQYDARKRRFTEQAYGLVQNLDNTWRLSYVVSLHEGRSRESRFGLNLQIEAVGF